MAKVDKDATKLQKKKEDKAIKIDKQIKLIKTLKDINNEIQEVVFKSLKHSAFGLLPENILYSMIKADDKDVKK